MSDGRKRLSGCEYRKRRALKEDDDKKQKDALQRYFKPKRERPSSDEGGKIDPESTEASAATAATSLSSGHDQKVNEHRTATTAYSSNADGGPSTTVQQTSSGLKTCFATKASRLNHQGELKLGDRITKIPEEHEPRYSPPERGLKASLGLTQIQEDGQKLLPTLVMRGPPECIKEAEECPKNADNRRFSPVHYSYSFKNLEEADRHWLGYSKSKDAVFCFYCKLFSSSTVKIVKNGISDWRQGCFVSRKSREVYRAFEFT
ncbi:zinc finger MYM-type protein 5-like [Schistocerca cancellata]|uniref:zinc finger MYM-type protein 5-like n=1 Tax=Schistocerca cancellata TaxID=274614 RepID=UPI002117F83B|nr:zinc finger MYM-type protein 5-like [Schistocerca cancellata]